jgi:hypothetical protein
MSDADLPLKDFMDDLDETFGRCNKELSDERFRWKKLECEMLDLREKLGVATNAISISVLSAVELQIKAVQREYDRWESFLIPDVEEDVLKAAAIKYAATFAFT